MKKKVTIMKKVFTLLMLFFCMLAFAAQSHAYNVTVNYDAGTTQITTQLTGYGTYGDMMDGMAVTAYFSGGGSQTLSWAGTGAGSGGVFGTAWSLVEVGDTWDLSDIGSWTLSATSNITGLFIDAGLGDTVFDTWYGVSGTAGSANGKPFAVRSSGTGDIVATYIDQVALTGDAPVGDLYRFLDIQFGAPFADTLKFTADTDNILYAGDIQPIPEPATMLLLGSGLIGLVGFGRKKFFKKS